MTIDAVKQFSFIACIFAGLISGHANATITGGITTSGTAFSAGGSFIKLSAPLSNPFGAPNSVGSDTFQSPNLYGFDEDQNIYITSALNPEVGSTIAANTYVASHYIFFDPNPTQTLIGSVNFDSNVLGIFTSTTSMAATDFLANTGVNYLNPSFRGLEAGDVAWISGTQQISINFAASTPGDYIRVLTAYSPTAAVPEPETYAMLLAGLGLLGFTARRKKNRAA